MYASWLVPAIYSCSDQCLLSLNSEWLFCNVGYHSLQINCYSILQDYNKGVPFACSPAWCSFHRRLRRPNGLTVHKQFLFLLPIIRRVESEEWRSLVDCINWIMSFLKSDCMFCYVAASVSCWCAVYKRKGRGNYLLMPYIGIG